MVDFHEEKSYIYLPKNLSYERDQFRRYFHDSLYLQALCDLRKKDFNKHPNNNCGSHITHDLFNRDISCKTEVSLLAAESNDAYILGALDLACSKSQCLKSKSVLKKSSETRWTKMEDNCFVIDSDDVHEKQCDSKCNRFLGNLACGLKSLTKRSQSPTLSDTDTDFSEDYMRMTDIGDDTNSVKSAENESSVHNSRNSTSSYDSTMSASSSMGTIEDEDFDRVTIKFRNNMELTPDDSFKNMESYLKASLSSQGNNEQTTSNPVDIPQKKTNVSGRRIKEKELPKIKLLLSKSPPASDMFDKGLPSFPLENNQESPEESPPASSGSLFVNQEFDYLETDKIKRSTSLKTYKTPPGTPHRKKVVRFADAMGLDLEDVKHVMNMDDPPNIPESAMKDLKIGLEEEHKTEGTKYLSTCFSQPGSNPNFIQLVNDTKVKLENCMVDGQDMTISGTVRVANITFHKRVVLRYTINNWTTFTDVFASYVQNSNDGATDRFSFTIGVPNYFSNGDKLQFAVMLDCGGQQFWDNNNGNNYTVECYAVAVPVTGSDNLWMHFL